MAQPASLPPLTTEQVKLALQSWRSSDQGPLPLAHLYLFRQKMRETGQSARHVTNALLLQGLEALGQIDSLLVDILRMRFLDGQMVREVANHYNTSDSNLLNYQRRAIKALTDLLSELDRTTWLAHQSLLHQRLEPPTYTALVGVNAFVQTLLEQLRAPQAPWLIALVGLGGIGKSSLAHYLAQQLIEQGAYDEIYWLSARQERLTFGGKIAQVADPILTAEQLIEKLAHQLIPELAAVQRNQPSALLPALRQRLKAFPHLIVIDNLETVNDLDALLPTLQQLANPSKFLLTSRESLYAATTVYHFQVPELPDADAFALIRQEAANSNLGVLQACAEDELRPIIETVGGNPLALRLVVGQAHIFSLETILAYLHAARGQSAQSLYTFIYWRAWHSLSPLEQEVLLMMPLVNPAGAHAAKIANVGQLTIDAVHNALNQLVTLNLIDVRGSHNDRMYTIHGLTRTFLEEQVLQW